jgi:phosphatidylserine/phosphatidylglycerophosphate/cardiolipin synthase-like enzyme
MDTGSAGFRVMGQPPVLKPYAFGALTLLEPTGADQIGASLTLGVYRDLADPLEGLFGLAAEGYVAGFDSTVDSGARLLAGFPLVFLQLGLDYNFRRSWPDFLLSIKLPGRRSGIFGRGTEIRGDWIPARSQTFHIGVQVPLGQHWAGRTRPHVTAVELPREPRAAPDTMTILKEYGRWEASIRQARSAAQRLFDFNDVLYAAAGATDSAALAAQHRRAETFRQRLELSDSLFPGGHSYGGEVALYHELLDRAFGEATGAPEPQAASAGAPLADKAKACLLNEVVLPYDRLLGQYKDNDQILGFGLRGRQCFEEWLATGPTVAATDRPTVLRVFDQLLALLEEQRRALLHKVGGNSRVVWLPLQLVLRDEQHDDQAKLDDLIGRAVDQPFSDGNAAYTFAGQQFDAELIEMLHATEDYHVLWVHDLRGTDEIGDPDSVAFAVVVNGYLDALTQKVKGYDRAGKLPLYILFLDQVYYQFNHERRWLSLLQDPLTHRVVLPPAYHYMESAIRAAQDSLRAAVAGSARLQAEASRRGQGWLKQVIRVQVNVTQPSDFSFRSSRIFVDAPIVPDNLVRDHRKIAFRDLTELDPAKGAAMYTGVGIGEQYASATWEDQAILVQGPAALGLKSAARELLLANGVKPSELPPPLRELRLPANYDDRVVGLEAAGATARALQAHNRVGFAQKDASVLRMMLYSLMPAGSVIYAPDAIWTSPLWASELLAAALRGCHVYVIAPSRDNAPSAGYPALSESRELLSRLLEAQTVLAPEIRKAGGILHVGLYTRRAPIGNPVATLHEVAQGYTRYPWLREEFPIPGAAYQLLLTAADSLAARGVQPERLVEDRVERLPKLHRKTQFFATRETLRELADQPQVLDAFRQVFADSFRTTFAAETTVVQRQSRMRVVRPFVQAFNRLPTHGRGRSVVYLTIGSMNMDDRGLYLDGEVLFALAGPWALSGYADFVFLAGATTWLQSQRDLDRLLPPYSERQRRRAYWIRKAI